MLNMFQHQSAEGLVSRCIDGKGRPATQKQIQADEERNVRN
jgi:hypothetical protein